MERSTQAVASLLHVPEKTMMRWMDGRAQMPLRAFLRALDLVVQHELRAGPLPVAEAPAERLVFKAGPAVAECAQCGCREFSRADPSSPHTYMSLLACRRCGAQVVHSDLIARLANEVAVRAGTYVARSRPTRKKARAQ